MLTMLAIISMHVNVDAAVSEVIGEYNWYTTTIREYYEEKPTLIVRTSLEEQ